MGKESFMFIYIPFICVTLGAVISWRGLPPRVLRVSDMIMNTALMLLMTVIGLNIGLSETVMKNLGRIGIKCLLISLAAIACSVALTVLCERTVMPLEKIRLALLRERKRRGKIVMRGAARCRGQKTRGANRRMRLANAVTRKVA